VTSFFTFSCLDKLARYFADLVIEDLEPPMGTTRIEDFLEAHWGSAAPRTYNKNLSIVTDFLKFQRMRGGCIATQPRPLSEPAHGRGAWKPVTGFPKVQAGTACRPR